MSVVKSRDRRRLSEDIDGFACNLLTEQIELSYPIERQDGKQVGKKVTQLGDNSRNLSMYDQLALTLFGSPEVRRHGQRVTGFRTSKAQALTAWRLAQKRHHEKLMARALAGLGGVAVVRQQWNRADRDKICQKSIYST